MGGQVACCEGYAPDPGKARTPNLRMFGVFSGLVGSPCSRSTPKRDGRKSSILAFKVPPSTGTGP